MSKIDKMNTKQFKEYLASLRPAMPAKTVPKPVVRRERAIIIIQSESDAGKVLLAAQHQQQLLEAVHNDLVKQLLAYNRTAKSQLEQTSKLEPLKFQQEATAEYTHSLLQSADYQRPGRDDIHIESKADSTLRDDPQWDRLLRRHHANIVRREEIQANKVLQKKQEVLRLNKAQEGLNEIVPGSIIALQDMETKMESRYYLTDDLPGHNRCLPEKTFPAPLEDVEIVCLDSELGKALRGRFVNDDIAVHAVREELSAIVPFLRRINVPTSRRGV